jgi:hypothetical protein
MKLSSKIWFAPGLTDTIFIVMRRSKGREKTIGKSSIVEPGREHTIKGKTLWSRKGIARKRGDFNVQVYPREGGELTRSRQRQRPAMVLY